MIMRGEQRLNRKSDCVQFRIASGAFLLLVVIGTATSAGAQAATTVPVTVNVTDPSGASIPNAEIELFPLPSPVQSGLKADAHGQLNLNLKPGAYCAAFSSPGFVTHQGHIDVRGPMTIPVKLDIGGCTECVTVTGIGGDDLVITALPYHQAILRPEDFKAMPHVSLTVRNSGSSKAERYSGVPLFDLLAKFETRQRHEPPDQPWADYVIATGANGYKAVLALAEFDTTFNPGKVLVADTLNGKPLDAQNGPFKLVVAYDRSSARSVPKLVAIEVKAAE